MSRTVLLGPQRYLITAGAVVRELEPDGPVAVVNAGWQDREADDAELHEVMGGRARNLRLHSRLLAVLEEDPRLAAAALALRDAVDELASLYSTRLRLGLEALYAVHRAPVPDDLRDSASADALAAVRLLDEWYLDVLGRLHGEFTSSGVLESSDALGRHRAEVAELRADCRVLCIAGGHVGVLGRVLRLFAVRPGPDDDVVAWSGGAMVVTDRVVLFRDPESAENPSAAGSFVGAEVWDRGLGRASGVVALPHARRRLRLDDPLRVSVLARRFADARCLLLEDGSRVEVGPDGALPPGAKVLTADGTVLTLEAVA